MPTLTLVRHAQASFFDADYDALSPLGLEQAAELGRHLARHGIAFEHVFVGPRRRHRQTYDAVASVAAAGGLVLPEPRLIPELDEHQGPAIIKAAMGRDPETPALAPSPTSPADPAAREEAMRQFFRLYDGIMREWARGAHALEGIESWGEFRARTLAALDVLCSGSGTRIAFTSGGFVSSAVGWLLGLDEDRVIDLSLILANTALTEVGFSGRRRRLLSFNALPHLPDVRAVTRV